MDLRVYPVQLHTNVLGLLLDVVEESGKLHMLTVTGSYPALSTNYIRVAVYRPTIRRSKGITVGTGPVSFGHMAGRQTPPTFVVMNKFKLVG